MGKKLKSLFKKGKHVEYKTVRQYVFYFTAVIVLFILLFVDMYDLCDICLTAYTLITLLASICTFLFCKWWYQKKDASDIYKWLTFTFLAIAISNGMQIYVRYLLYTHDINGYMEFIDSYIWYYRNIPMLFSLTFMVSFIISAMYGTKSILVKSGEATIFNMCYKDLKWLYKVESPNIKVLCEDIDDTKSKCAKVKEVIIAKKAEDEVRLLILFGK